MYIFTDYDDEEIAADDYVELIRLCCAFSKTFSLAFPSEAHIAQFSDRLVPQRCEQIDGTDPFRKYRCFFAVTEESEQFLATHVTEFFQWVHRGEYHNPEDLAFYREDGTLFLWSETHEGICAIFERASEDVTEIVKKEGWKAFTLQNVPYGIPQFLCRNACEG